MKTPISDMLFVADDGELVHLGDHVEVERAKLEAHPRMVFTSPLVLQIDGKIGSTPVIAIYTVSYISADGLTYQLTRRQ